MRRNVLRNKSRQTDGFQDSASLNWEDHKIQRKACYYQQWHAVCLAKESSHVRDKADMSDLHYDGLENDMQGSCGCLVKIANK